MLKYTRQKGVKKHSGSDTDIRLRAALVVCLFFITVIIGRLFVLMVVERGFYTALAAGSQEIYAQLVPKRGDIWIQDSRTGERYPLAINRDVFTVFADTRELSEESDREFSLEALVHAFGYTDERREQVRLIFQKQNDPYEPIEKSVDEKKVDELRAMDLPGIGFVRQEDRYYPEGPLAAHVVGFVRKNDVGEERVGNYGIEGYWNRELAGSGGFLEAAKSVAGAWIPLAGRSFDPAEDGADIVLTIDRTLQFQACERLRQAREEYGAVSASLIIMDPMTGAIRAMCSLPDFDPNTYNKVEGNNVYNNTTIFTAYEPGSIFKPITMLAGIEEGVVTPDTVFHDTGSREAKCAKPIKNAEEKIYNDTTMTGVLENSINTGMVYVVERLGKNVFIDYLEAFGFGVRQDVHLDTEVGGTIDALYRNKGGDIDCYTATAAFGQGITATPLQMVTAFSVIANGGRLMKPYIVEEIQQADGRVERVEPREIKRIVSSRAASLLSAMLVRVIDSGQAGAAAVDGYYVAGKTGTAQIAGRGGYTNETNHSFVGFAPVDNPKFVMLVKFEKPQRSYSSITAAPVFGDIAEFILGYYHIPPAR
jgi:cell division protein FtsI/penicillin-binding protein 2